MKSKTKKPTKAIKSSGLSVTVGSPSEKIVGTGFYRAAKPGTFGPNDWLGLFFMHTIYCSGYENSAGFIAQALADDGHTLAMHCCSHIGYARRDLGMDGGTWKHDLYDAHFGAGNWQLEWVSPDDVKTHPGWRAAFKLNQEMAAKEEATASSS